MSHPPIPPRCPQFWQSKTNRGHWLIKWPQLLYEPEKRSNTIVATAPEDERPFIAAVAEVEWRRRARRWEELIDAIWRRFHNHKSERYPCTDDGRTARCRERANECYANALKWRAWGEGIRGEKKI